MFTRTYSGIDALVPSFLSFLSVSAKGMESKMFTRMLPFFLI